MKEMKYANNYRVLFVLIIALAILSTLVGLICNNFYQNALFDLTIKARFYDLALLVIVIPICLITEILIVKKNDLSMIFSLGITVYLFFSYGVTVFTYNQNILFLVYISILVLCSFFFIQGFFEADKTILFVINRKDKVIAASILLFSAISGFGYWLVDAVILTFQTLSITESLNVKPPQVFDMVFTLPFSIYGSIRLLRNKNDGVLISMIMTVFFIFIAISVVIMEVGYSLYTRTELDYGKIISYFVITALNIINALNLYRKVGIERLVVKNQDEHLLKS